MWRIIQIVACSQNLYFLFKVRRARVIKNRNRGRFIDRQRKWVGVGKNNVGVQAMQVDEDVIHQELHNS